MSAKTRQLKNSNGNTLNKETIIHQRCMETKHTKCLDLSGLICSIFSDTSCMHAK